MMRSIAAKSFARIRFQIGRTKVLMVIVESGNDVDLNVAARSGAVPRSGSAPESVRLDRRRAPGAAHSSEVTA